MIQHGINTVIFIDVLNPFCRNSVCHLITLTPCFQASPFLNQELLLWHHQLIPQAYRVIVDTNWIVVPSYHWSWSLYHRPAIHSFIITNNWHFYSIIWQCTIGKILMGCFSYYYLFYIDSLKEKTSDIFNK
jgi:hypothetical protein